MENKSCYVIKKKKKKIIKLVLKNVMKLAKSSLDNIFRDSFNKILSQQLIHDRFYLGSPPPQKKKCALCFRQFSIAHYA